MTGDLTDLSSLIRALHTAQPDEVYNLGAISFVAYSWENARLTSEVTGLGVLNMLEATRLYCGDDIPRSASTRPRRRRCSARCSRCRRARRTLLWPRSPYGVAKVFGHYMTINYRESYGMHASSGILFNHESPRRGPEFVTRKISRAVARISLGLQDSISLGNLDAKRDWGFAGDYVDAMWRMVQADGGRRLRGRHRGDPLDPGIPGHRLRPGRHRRLVQAGLGRSAVLPAGRGRPADR